jgi:hypothetical protein
MAAPAPVTPKQLGHGGRLTVVLAEHWKPVSAESRLVVSKLF